MGSSAVKCTREEGGQTASFEVRVGVSLFRNTVEHYRLTGVMQIRDPLTGVCGGADYAFLRMFEKN